MGLHSLGPLSTYLHRPAVSAVTLLALAAMVGLVVPAAAGPAPARTYGHPAPAGVVALGWGAPAAHFAIYNAPVATSSGLSAPASGAGTSGAGGPSATHWSDGGGNPGPGSMMMHCSKMTRMQALSASWGPSP